jgi:hypothetical protein
MADPKQRSYDSKCYELAEHFLSAEPDDLNTHALREALAENFQSEAEQFIALMRRQRAERADE